MMGVIAVFKNDKTLHENALTADLLRVYGNKTNKIQNVG